MVWAFLILELAVLVAAAGTSLCPAALARALPFVDPPGLSSLAWPLLAAGLAAVAALVAIPALARARRAPGRLRALLELVVAFVPATAYVWAVLPGSGPRWADGPALLALAALAVWFLWRDRRDPEGCVLFRPTWRQDLRRDFGPAARLLAAPTALMIAAPAVVGLLAHARPRPGPVLLSLLGYPLYAFVQLCLLLALPWPRLRRLTRSPAEAIAAAAVLFALAHWPNGPLMAGCLLAMLVWAGVYRVRPNLPALALSMGLAATAVVQMLPPDRLVHARVGPGYLRFRVVEELAAASDASAPEEFVRGLYPTVIGRPATAGEIAAWQSALSHRLRERIAWQFLDSDEHRARDPQTSPPRGVRWSDLGEPWRSRLTALGSDETCRAAGGDERGFLVMLYRELLGRTPAEAELAAWRPAFALSPIQREHLVETLYDHRRELARPGGEAPVIAGLRLP